MAEVTIIIEYNIESNTLIDDIQILINELAKLMEDKYTQNDTILWRIKNNIKL